MKNSVVQNRRDVFTALGGVGRAATHFARAGRAPKAFDLGLTRILSPDAALGDNFGRSATTATLLGQSFHESS